jgi:hypothetical protein
MDHQPAFVCTSSPSDPAIGACARAGVRCSEYQQAFSAAGHDMTPCVDASAALCFDLSEVADLRQLTLCAPTTTSCEHLRAEKSADATGYTGVSACQDRR